MSSLRLAFGLSLCAFLAASAAALPGKSFHWDYRSPATTPDLLNGVSGALSAVNTPDGEPAFAVRTAYAFTDLKWPPSLHFPANLEDCRGVDAVAVDGWIKGPAGASVTLRVSNTRWNPRTLADSQTWRMDGAWQKITFRKTLRQPASGHWFSAPRLIFGGFQAGQTFLVGPLEVAFSRRTGDPSAPAPGATSGWRALDTSDLCIAPGGALDFTPFADAAPAGAHGRVIANSRGEFAFADRPDSPVRFLAFQWVPSPYAFPHLTDAQLAAFADAIARQGYNMVRFHFLDDLINGNSRAPALKRPSAASRSLPLTPGDIHWDPAAMDRLHRFLFELKRRGVYWNFDLMTSFVGYTNGTALPSAASGHPELNTKVQLFVNPDYRANWRAAAIRLLTDVNPYTGLPPRDDPALALVVCLNEQEILVPHRDYGRELDPAWHAYLKEKYKTYAALHAAWSGRCGDAVLPAPVAADEGPGTLAARLAALPPIDRTALADTPAGNDMARACGRMECEVSEFYLSVLREIGYAGLSSNWNMRPNLLSVPARSLFPVVTMNYYHAHPRFGKQTTVDQRSALALGGNGFKSQALARFLDRPFVNTEFGIVFWNPYRHEQGLLFGAGAALQGWGALTCYHGQVVESGEPLRWFLAGDDPVIRAAETVEAHAFRRGDVSPSPHTLEIPVDDPFIFTHGRAFTALSDELSRLWPLCRIGIGYGGRRAAVSPDLSVSPDHTASIGGDDRFSTVQDAGDGTTRLDAIAARLRDRGVLGADNATAPSRGIFQSDTRQVTLDASPSAGGELFVRAPRLEGAVLKRDHRQSLDALTIARCTVPASVSLISIDPRPEADLRTAHRLLLVFSTDARNSGMTFANGDEGTLRDIGTLPVLVRTGRLEISLDRPDADRATARAWALKLNGERAAEVPVHLRKGALSLDIDTAALPARVGPTPFYEIEIE